MATRRINKITISTAPPKPSNRIIGGANQRSVARLNLQTSTAWKYNHNPLGEEQSQNAHWWRASAPRYVGPLSGSGNILYDRQNIQREVQRADNATRIYNTSFNLEKTIGGGANQPYNKKQHITGFTFGILEPEIDIVDEMYPHIKKRATFKATLDGTDYVAEQLVPFSAFSSSVTTGYQSELSSSGFPHVDFANLHEDKVQSYRGEIPMQGPFTERHVGGIEARHNPALMTSERKEQFNISLNGGFAIATITISTGGGAFNTANYNTKTVTISFGGVSFAAELDNTADMSESTESVTGIADASGITDVATSLTTSLNAGASEQGLRISAHSFGSVIFIYATVPGPSMNGLAFGGTLVASAYASTADFAGGVTPSGAINSIEAGNTPKGQYLRGSGAKAPVNIGNIKTSFVSNSVRLIGNYTRNYEVLQGSNRMATNIDLAANPDNYNYSTPSFFITPPEQRALGITGSADYPAPRQIATRKISQTIFVNQFSAPGGKDCSNQQFRDVSSNQMSPNSALPFRNLPVRLPYLKTLGASSQFGVAGNHKVQRNQTRRVELSGSSANTFITASLVDTYFFNRPVPAGDSTQWFFSLSGSDTQTYNHYVLSGSHYPDDINYSSTYFATNTFGAGLKPALDGGYKFVWINSLANVAPFTQTRIGSRSQAKFMREKNLYELNPEIETLTEDSNKFADDTQFRTYTDQGGNTINKYYSQQFTEPPITSKYKPLVHQINTFIGSPSKETDNKIDLTLEYAYGNSLMGFANRELNRQLEGSIKFGHNKVKRPYEVLREQLKDPISYSLNGVNMIKMFAYSETIFPREVNTYLSGSRARLSFKNSYWRSDAKIEPVTVFYPNFNTLFYSPEIERRDNPQVPRLVAPFTTSQGFVVQRVDQLPYNGMNPAYPLGTGPGTASMWPLDSYLWSSLADEYASSIFNTGTFNASVILADQSTTACGELLMTNFGTVSDSITDSTVAFNTASLSLYTDSNIVSSQYVYSIGYVTGTSSPLTMSVMPRIPGGPFSRPPWTAGTNRRQVDGKTKGAAAAAEYPFYNSYEDWSSDLRLIGKSHSIIPEYRVSEHVEQFKTNRSLFTVISSSLEITGSNTDNFDGTNTNFYNRYATTDTMEFMGDFMSYDKGDINYIFNKYPRHLEINSDAIMKLLPYEGFYPVNRTLQISTLFSQSYSPAAQFAGSEKGQMSQWRALLRPFFAPGIIYNSIKSGVAVDFPIRRVGRNYGGFKEYIPYDVEAPTYRGYGLGGPLFGAMNERVSSDLGAGQIPGASRRNRESFNWANPDVNRLFWADRLPFESILDPEDYLTADLDTTTGSLATVMPDINWLLHLNVTASFQAGTVKDGTIDSDNLYKKAVSNFLANVPQFFLTTKENKYGSPGKLTKFVSQFGNPSRGSQETTTSARTVSVNATQAYMMEIGLLKTDQFNLYSNPAAFGPATNPSCFDKPWHVASNSGSWIPDGTNWPTHQAEFAPFTPPYYHGPSLIRITFMPAGDKTEYTLDEIINNDRNEVFTEYLNESGSYYDANSGSFVDSFGNTLTTNATPAYEWNRAWLNRMDIDASINIGNEFPTSAGSAYKSADPNKWTIMPKWESPILDFPKSRPAVAAAAASATITATAFGAASAGQLIKITTDTTIVNFEFTSAVTTPARLDANNYTVGIKTLGNNLDFASRIEEAIQLCTTNGEIDVTAARPSSLSPIVGIISNVNGSSMNGKTIGGSAVGSTPSDPVNVTAFADGADAVAEALIYNFSSSVTPGEFTQTTQGMWHQYGMMPDAGQGVYMYIKDIATGEDEEYDLVAITTAGAGGHATGSYHQVKKVPKFVVDTGRTISSLADLCGFNSSEIIRKGFDTTKAKRLGELAADNENSISEAVLALPFYLDENGEPKLITLQASPDELGPKIKEFRKKFTKYSLPPVLSQKLLGLVPKSYPTLFDTINPFGGDEYDQILAGEDIKQIPVVYLMEHTANLTRQDLADIWQGIMPDLSTRLNFSFSAIDHYMPGDNVEEAPTQFPEVLKEQINVGADRDGNPRYDLLDIAEKACKQGFFPEIRWLVFKVKERGISSYQEMIIQEVDGPNALGYDNSKEFLTLQGLTSDQVERTLGERDDFAKNVYISKHALSNPTFNWPYDYCSLLESVKINSRVGFRPDLKKEYEEVASGIDLISTAKKDDNK